MAGSGAANRVVATILLHEVRLLTGTFRFYASAFLLVSLLVLAAVTAAARYRGESLEQEAVTDEYAARLAGATVDQVVEILHPAIRSPWRLALVVDGGQAATPDAYGQALSALVAPRLWRIHSGNHRLPGSEPLDWMFVIRVVLPFSAFLLGYNAVCGEHRAGTLKLLLSYPVPRWKIFTGKLLAIWSCLAAPFLAGAALSLLIATGLGGVPLHSQDLIKAGLLALLGLWAAAFFTLVALLVRSLARDSSTSLSVLAWLWVTAVIVVPAVSGLLAHRLHPISAEGEIGQEMEAIDQRIAREYAGREGRWRPPQWATSDGFAWERSSAEAENRRFAFQEEVRRRAVQRKLGQTRLARNLASLSPTSLIQDLAERLTGSGLWRDESFLRQAWAFRSVLAEQVRALDARDPESPRILFFSGYVSKRPIKPGAIERFAFRERSVRQGLAAARPVLALLAFETLALAAASLYFFSRYDAG
ncbi:MAG TPA: ABC transporter permease subunit [Thermoanaerobaculia bacterium]|jgi:ABC-type transport system involved in multi-copper enzyme maturation permease subunit